MKPKQTLANKWAGQKCKLNGKPSRIGGRLMPYATIGVLPEGPEYQWSWPAVDRIMQKDSNFIAK